MPNLRKSYQPNLRKSNPDLSKPSEPSFQRKPESSQPSNSLSAGIRQEIGSIGGVSIEARASVDLATLIPKQGISVERDASKGTTAIGLGLGSTRSKLGINIGAEFTTNADGSTEVSEVSGGVNVAGFGVEGRVGKDGKIGGAITIFGITVDVAKDANGGISGGISINLPGGSIGIGFQSDAPKNQIIVTADPIFPTEPEPEPPPPPPPNTPIITNVPPGELVPVPPEIKLPFNDQTNLLEDSSAIAYVGICGGSLHRQYSFGYYGFGTMSSYQSISTDAVVIGGLTDTRLPNGNIDVSGVYFRREYQSIATSNGPKYKLYDKYNRGYREVVNYVSQPNDSYNIAGGRLSSTNDSTHFLKKQVLAVTVLPSDYLGGGGTGSVGYLFRGPQNAIAKWIKDQNALPGNNSSTILSGGAVYYINTLRVCEVIPLIPVPKTQPSPQLPNIPQRKKKMDCCKEVKEIYKYLGIEKLKKNKFPVSNAFLVPGGKGNDECVDYYAIAQALFRMLANGLIINPKSKPLGSEWQNTNATAWASNMYEMMAESMSDGNSTQRFEVAAMMQMVQMMAAVAENGRKIEFVADAIGFEPLPVAEELPVCFTIHESHKGFGKKEPKKIDTSKLKTDDEVEAVLGKMLNPSLVPIVKWKFKPGQISISEALRRG